MNARFKNDDANLLQGVERALREREKSGLNGLVGGLEFVVINVEPDRHQAAAMELMSSTGLRFDCAFEDSEVARCVLTREGSADFVIAARKGGDNPFRPYNIAPKSKAMPDTRLETFVFNCPDLREYVRIQHGRSIGFLTEEVVETDAYLFIQTPPSRYTGNSVGLVQWKGAGRNHAHSASVELDWDLKKPDFPHLENIYELDHCATRVRAEHRDQAIIEFMDLTNYNFEFAVYVDFLNSITNVARLSDDEYAQVFTSGIEPFQTPESSGPTEKFIYNYGLRVHHMAFRTENIEQTVDALKANGLGFLSDLVGSPEEGLKQAFSNPFPQTFLVNEYIKRYGDFDGFFTKSNVTLLTEATNRQ